MGWVRRLFNYEFPLNGVEALSDECPLAGGKAGRPGNKVFVVVVVVVVVGVVLVKTPSKDPLITSTHQPIAPFTHQPINPSARPGGMRVSG